MKTEEKRFDSEKTYCDGCGRAQECAKLGPDGEYMVALCGDCFPSFKAQQMADFWKAYAASPEAAADWEEAGTPRSW